MRVKRLGRGLENLLNRTGPDTPGKSDAEPADGAAPGPTGRAASGNGNGNGQGVVRQIPLETIRANPFQPRRIFGEEGLAELCESIREHGLLQPVVVRVAGEGFEIVAGERRLRAAKALGMKRIPALVRSASNEEMQTLALVENLQREDLNAMEKARALHAMMRNFVLTQEDVATRVGKARTTIANLLRLLDLPEEIQAWVEEGKLSGAHARAVLQAKGDGRRVELARQAVLQGWSVRELERRARSGPTVGRRRTRAEDPYVRDLEERLRRALSTDVRLRPRGKGGRIEIPYHDADELDRLLELLKA
jgi:ParB family chromosome partitioning protein